MNNPIYANTIRYYLQFENVSDEWFEIFEPIYSDANTLNIEQQANGYGRDIRYKDGKLRFINAYYTELETPQQINPQGDTSNHLSHLLGWWFYVLQKYGFGAKVNYKENINGIDTDVYGFDLKGDKLTDWQTYVEAELIDTGKVAKVKRTLETSFNAFSDKDWGGNAITPMTTFNYLLRAIPQFKESNLKQTNNFSFYSQMFGNDAFIYNPCVNQGALFEIRNTLSSLDAIEYIADNSDNDDKKTKINNRCVIKAKRRISNLKIKLSDISGSIITTGFFTNNQLTVAYGTEPIDSFTTIDLFNSSNVNFVFSNLDYEVTIPFLDINQKVWIYFSTTCSYPTPAGTPVSTVTINLANTIKIDMFATETAPDFVIKASRYIDLIKQSSLFNQNIPVNASRYDVGGIHYNNAVFTKRMIGRKVDTFNTTPKKVYDSVIEPNNHVEMYSDEIYINHHTEFYKNNEIGVLFAHPDKDYNVSINPKSTVNVFNIGFGQYEQDRTTTGSNESIHTEAEFRILEEQSEDKFSRKFEFVRDGIMRQKAVDLEVNNPTASTQDDDIIFAEAMTALPPNSFGTINGVYYVRTFGFIVEILNFDSEGEVGDNAFTWDMLGIGNTGELLIFGGVTNVTITEITPSKITMTSSLFLGIFALDSYISLKYYYTGVAYQTKTNEGYTLVSGVTNKMSNLDYTLGRIARNYYSEQLANYAMYCQKDITCGYFKGIPDSRTVLTQRTDETEPISENGIITFNSLPNPLIDGYVIDMRLVATYEQIVNIRTNYRVNRGFVRLWDREAQRIEFGFIKMLAYNPITGEATGKFERKYTPPILTITGTIDNLLVNDVPYNLSGIANWWVMRNGFLTLYDKDSIPISYEYEYNLVNLNGVIYDTYDELSDALSLLT